MPLNETCSVSALEANIASEIRAGKPRAQAVAIAQSTLRKACKKAGKPIPARKAFDVIAGQPTVGISAMSTSSAEWMVKNDIVLEDIEFVGDPVLVEIDEGVVASVRKRAPKRERTREFLEDAFKRARKVLNPRDFAMIFQAARASAGGQVSAKRRKERAYLTAAENQLINKASLKDMNKAELQELSQTLNKAYSRNEKTGSSIGPVLSRAGSMREEFHRRGFGDPPGPVYATLEKRGKDVRKGFVNGEPEGGMHAHGLDRRNAKTLDDGGHLHIWVLPGTGELFISAEDGQHAHTIPEGGASTETGGQHSHRVLMSGGAMVETKLGGAHAHELMVETTGFSGLHTHTLVMPDGTELESMTPSEFVATLSEPPFSHPLPHASPITRAMNELRMERESMAVGSALPPPLPDLAEAVELTIQGVAIPPPTFAIESDDGDMLEVRYDGEVVGMSKHVTPDDPETIENVTKHWQLIQRYTTPVPFSGPEDAKLLFLAAAPNDLELARKQALVGEDALTFNDIYLRPLGLTKKDVATGFVMPVLPFDELSAGVCEKWSENLVKTMKAYPYAKIVAIGKPARDVLKSAGIEFWSLPHPSVVRRRGNSGEVARKLRAIGKALDVAVAPVAQFKGKQGDKPAKPADARSGMRKTGRPVCRVVKTADEKQIVYGVVLDPYVVDLQSDWIPPAEIESTAHGFLKKSRVIGFEHVERAEAQILESWVEPYPSTADYEAAMENRPHRAFSRKFGDDVIHSGSWVAGVQLGDREWALHKQGKLNAFSVGGFSFKSKVTTDVMPEVEFVELTGVSV